MTPKQKRAYKKAAIAMAELARDTMNDGQAYNLSIQLVTDTLGTMIGTVSGLSGLQLSEMDEALNRAFRVAQESAAETYAKSLAFDRSQSGRVN